MGEILRREIEEDIARETDEDRKAVFILQLFCDHDFKAVATGQVCIDECTKCGRTYTY